MNYYKEYLNGVFGALENTHVTMQNNSLGCEEGIAEWCERTKVTNRNSNNIYLIGNGASAMMASHMAADATKNGGLMAHAFNDSSLLTAVGNDIDFEEIFSYPIGRYAKEGDVLISISSSGNSKNIVKGIEKAIEKKMHVITLSGMGEDNAIRKMGHLNFYVPAATYGHVETAHQILLHCWLDKYCENNVQ